MKADSSHSLSCHCLSPFLIKSLFVASDPHMQDLGSELDMPSRAGFRKCVRYAAASPLTRHMLARPFIHTV